MDLRALLQIDRLQPQFAAYTGATVQGSVPLAGDALLVGEIGPGNEVFRVVDVALKAADVQATSQIVEREFGFFILRSPAQAEVSAAREAILAHFDIHLTHRRRPVVESSQIITSVEPYQAQLLNKWRSGSLLVPGETLGILEVRAGRLHHRGGERGREDGDDQDRGGADRGALREDVHLRLGGRRAPGHRGRHRQPDRARGSRVNVVGEEHVRDAFRRGQRKLVVANEDIVTPQALDAVERLGLQIVRGPLERPAPMGSDPGRAIRRTLYRRGARWVASERPRGLTPTRFARLGFIGAGGVGAATAHLAALAGIADEIRLIDIVPGVAESIALDIEHASGVTGSPTRAHGGTTLDLVRACDAIVIDRRPATYTRHGPRRIAEGQRPGDQIRRGSDRPVRARSGDDCGDQSARRDDLRAVARERAASRACDRDGGDA